MPTIKWSILLLGGLLVVIAGCGDRGSSSADQGSGDEPTIVTTTTMLGDVVGEMVGDQARVETLMPAGTNAHEFQASAQQAAAMRSGDAMITNGADLEEGLVDAVDAAEADGVPTYQAIQGLSETITFGGEHDHDHATGDHEGHDHTEGSVDPHFFTSPARMMQAAEGIAGFLTAEVPALDTDAFRTGADDYISQLGDLDAEVTETLSAVPDDRRVMVTSHEAFAYYADDHGFEVVGTVIPSGSTSAGASARQLADLAEVIKKGDVPVIFTDQTLPPELAETLADEVGDDVELISLYTGSLGEEGSDGDTYVGYVRTNAERIAGALADQS